MGVGLSDGSAYKDTGEWLASVDHRTDKERSDQTEINQNSMSGDFQSRFGASDASTMPLQASTELAGALKQVGGTKVPGEVPVARNLGEEALATINKAYEWKQDFNNRRLGWQQPSLSPGDPNRDTSQDIKTKYGITITPEDINKAIDIGMAVGPGTMAGIKSKTLPKQDLYKAQNLELDAAHPDDIHEATGFFRGADSRWRYEIDDSKAALKDSAFNKSMLVESDKGVIASDPKAVGTVTLKSTTVPRLPDNANTKELTDWFIARREHNAEAKLHLPDVLDHPELYKAYPDLKALRVEPLPEGIQRDTSVMGHMSADGPAGTLRLRDDLNPNYAKSVILHEVQHQIQQLEGFAPGGGKERFLPPKLPEAEALLKSAKETVLPQIKEKGFTDQEINRVKWISTLDQDALNVIYKNHPEVAETMVKAKGAGVYNQIKNIARSEKLLKDANDEAFTKYQRIMGEVEARNVQTRMNYDKFQRAFIPPVRTEEVPRFQQIELKNKGTSMSEEPTNFRRAANDNKRGSMESFIDEQGQIRGSRIDKVMDDVDKSWKEMAKTQDRRRELMEESHRMKDLFVDRDWSDFEYARFNKINKELYGEHWTPTTREELNKPLE